MKRFQHTPCSGFTLVELSIVLVIIGLILGGVTLGRNLVRGAEIRSVISDAQRYQAAIVMFKDRYDAMPGDMPNATQYWGRADGGANLTQNCANPDTDVGTGTQTCNGNGDGLVASAPTWPLNNSEGFRFWQHLANAGFIEGKFTGVGHNAVAGNPTWNYVFFGENAPASKMQGGGYFVTYKTMAAGGIWTGSGIVVANALRFCGMTANTLPFDALLDPAEALSIDMKMDDGKPGSGNVWAFYSTPCTTTNVTTTANYASSGTRTCSLVFLLPPM